MTILRRQDYRTMPWKNGGGQTTEIATSPAGSDLSEFDWRVSMASVRADGPFSVFPGIDRSLSVLEGEGLKLLVGGTPYVLTPDSAPLFFAADTPTVASLIDGVPVTDLNIMTRRGKWSHEMRHVLIDNALSITPNCKIMIAFCHVGTVSVMGAGQNVRLESSDTLIAEDAAGTWTFIADKAASLFIVFLTPMT